MIRTFMGAVMAGLAFMAGLWLMIAPFALGTQPENASWTSATTSQFWTGLGVAVVALAGVAAFVIAIRDELVTRGLVEARKPEPAPTPPPAAPSPETSSSELATLLAPLVEALREDLNHRPGRRNGSAPLVGTEENR
ncbi:hypothetical protein ACIBQX_45040 [Nonomuraea sp. NPDC049714]|uniref:hypothetical protein n=1 Tax=Nonomuraea sp. NPDC049714 TaxID=3364357 RepID=UPI00378B9331